MKLRRACSSDSPLSYEHYPMKSFCQVTGVGIRKAWVHCLGGVGGYKIFGICGGNHVQDLFNLNIIDSMMFKKALLVAFISATLASTKPIAQANDPAPSVQVPGLGEPCGFIWGTKPCSNPHFKCCYRYPDAGYCLPVCPKKYPPA
ncbi:hypothetical protein P691DRAFT_480409 [Macrolepiota fuliginosa MF-IS2]|uniref:Uncharacterized protein n=1 Tax=Macrolepiota fuliginosa MF-IS2 TaxID=1400762 RepID=A0A9P5XGJ2_9AGAR|nr:hypothetical protein P691DRAFT_480409 [Macrolepiota fuliginosa MF-IS2]